MQADTTTLAPTDAEIEAMRDAFDWDGWTCPKAAQRAFARAVLAKWGAPAPASGDGVRKGFVCVACECVYADAPVSQCDCCPERDEFYEVAISRKAPPAQEARVPLTGEQERCIAEAHNVAACEEYFSARPQIDFTANRRIFEAGFSKGYSITAAQKEPPCAPTPSL